MVYHSSQIAGRNPFSRGQNSKPPNGSRSNLPVVGDGSCGWWLEGLLRISDSWGWSAGWWLGGLGYAGFIPATHRPRPKRAASAAPARAQTTAGARAAVPSRTTNAAPVQRTAAPKQRAAAPSKTNGGEILGELKIEGGKWPRKYVHTRYPAMFLPFGCIHIIP